MKENREQLKERNNVEKVMKELRSFSFIGPFHIILQYTTLYCLEPDKVRLIISNL